MAKKEDSHQRNQEDRLVEQEVISEIRGDVVERGQDEFWDRLFGPEEDYLPMVSAVSASDRPKFLYAIWYAKEFQQEWLERLVKLDLALRVSEKRLGRKEAVQAMTGSMEQKQRRRFSLMRGEG